LAHTNHIPSRYLNGKTRSRKQWPQGVFKNQDDEALVV